MKNIPISVMEKIQSIISRRSLLVALLEQPNLGALRLDATQALDELDELIEELNLTFPLEN
jgi:hypothetical protein